jgi:hypothetical protein
VFPIFPVDYPFIERGPLLPWTRTTRQGEKYAKPLCLLINTVAGAGDPMLGLVGKQF